MYAVDMLLRRQFLALRKDANDAQRQELDGVWRSRVEPVDIEHTRRLEALLKGRGWFPISEIGLSAASDVLTLANHSADLAFQRRVVAMLDQLPAEERPSGYANIWDRVALEDGRLQRYGTQDFECVDGHYVPSSRVEDPVRLEERRAAVGLEPMSENLASMDKMYGRCSQVTDRPLSKKR